MRKSVNRCLLWPVTAELNEPARDPANDEAIKLANQAREALRHAARLTTDEKAAQAFAQAANTISAETKRLWSA